MMAALTMEQCVTAILALILSFPHHLTASTTQAPDNTTDVSTNATTPVPEFRLTVKHVESTTSSIKIEWAVPWIYYRHIQSFAVKSKKLDSDSVLSSPSMNNSVTSFEVEYLLTNAKYVVCVEAYFNYDNVSYEEDATVECLELFTIPLIKWQNLVACIGAISYIIIMILAGVTCWCCAKKRIRSKRESERGSNDENKELLEEEVAVTNPVLLSVPRTDRPRSSIEEELPFIPFITPPLEELDQDESPPPKYYTGAANNI